MPKCPGQDQRYWKPDDIFEINCLECRTLIEFWKDEPTLKCPKCKTPNTNPKLDLSCAEWCKYAKECLGGRAGLDSNILCNSLTEEMKKVFGGLLSPLAGKARKRVTWGFGLNRRDEPNNLRMK